MFRLIKKVQQDYIAAKLQDKRTHWCEFREGVLLTTTGHTLLYIPDTLLYVKLDASENATYLKSFGDEKDGDLPAEYKGLTAEGLAIFAAGGKEALTQEKLVKPFLAVKGVQIKVKDEKSPVRFYTADDMFLGLVMPMRPPRMRP